MIKTRRSIMNRKTVTLTLAVEQQLADGARRLADLLAFCEGDGITVTAVQDDKNGVVLKDGKAVIHYTRQHVFYRELGVLCENARKSDAFASSLTASASSDMANSRRPLRLTIAIFLRKKRNSRTILYISF